MASPFLDAVTQHADNVLAECRDRYGNERTPLLVDFYKPDTAEPGRWREVLHSSSGAKTGPERIPSNLALQQGFLRTLHGLAGLSGRQRYSKSADEWIEHAFTVLREPTSGLLYWGGHATYDLERNEPVVGCHELKCAYPDYRALHRVDPTRTQLFVEGFWERHVHDWSNLLFNRHGAYAGKRLRVGTGGFWDRTFDGGDLPIVENESLAFINTGSDLILAGGLLSVLSGHPAPGQWARRLLGQFDRIRHPETQLGGYQINHREPCRIRICLKPPFNQINVNETNVLRAGCILTRYGRLAVTLINLADEAGEDEGQAYLDFARRDLSALAKHSYDFSTHCFHPLITDGRRITPDDCAEDVVGYCKPASLAPVTPNGLMFLAYAMAYRATGDKAFRDVALDLAAAMGWSLQCDGDAYRIAPEASKPAPGAMRSSLENRAANTENDVACLFAWLELARADGRRDLVDVASRWGELLLDRYFRDGFFFDAEKHADDRSQTGLALCEFVRVGSALPLAFLQLAAAIDNKTFQHPLFYPNLHDFSGLKNYYPETGYPGQPDRAEESSKHASS